MQAKSKESLGIIFMPGVQTGLRKGLGLEVALRALLRLVIANVPISRTWVRLSVPGDLRGLLP